jgi:acetylornithine deacetylase/succinyl-diaminopimelate desuccinylase-like protein
MLAYIARRILLMIPTIFGIMLVSFIIVQFAPGGPVERIIAQLQGFEAGATSRFGGGGSDIGQTGSGQVGGAAPDALQALLRALDSLLDENGDVSVPGLRREKWTGASYSDEEFRELAEVEPGVPFFGTGGLGERLWTGPAVTVTGIDVLPVDRAVNAVVPYARAKLSLRVHPEQDPSEAQGALIAYLESLHPFGVSLMVHAAETGQGFAAATTGRAYDAARAALAGAWGNETVSFASGGSIPLVSALQEAVPGAEMLLIGTTDGFANIHAPNERVLLDEFEKATIAEADFFGRYAANASAERSA